MNWKVFGVFLGFFKLIIEVELRIVLGPKNDVFGFSWRADLRQIWDHLGAKRRCI